MGKVIISLCLFLLLDRYLLLGGWNTSSSPPTYQSTPPRSRSSSSTRERDRSTPPRYPKPRSRTNSHHRPYNPNDPEIILPPFAHTQQEPAYIPQSEYYRTESLDQAFTSLNQFFNSTANDISSHLHSMYHQAQQFRSRSNSASSSPSTTAANNNNNNPPGAATTTNHPRASPVAATTSSRNNSPRNPAPPTATSPSEHADRLTLSRDLLDSLNILELRMILTSYGIEPSQDCIDKQDHIDLLARCPQVELIE